MPIFRTSGLRAVPPFDGSDPIDDILTTAKQRIRPAECGHEELLLAEAASLLRSGEGLGGLLAFSELTLETGAALPPELAGAMNSCTDPRIKLLWAALAPPWHTETDRRALSALDKLRTEAPSRHHVLCAFEANVRARLGEANVAKELLGRAIAANPRLTGAYKDLGDVYLQTWDIERAWHCWDIARTIAPFHPVLKGVEAFEQALLREHFEYFSI
jgi:tetratricopeptide (TPR) repeat protein